MTIHPESIFPSGYNQSQKLDCQPPGGKEQVGPSFAALVVPHVAATLRALQLFPEHPLRTVGPALTGPSQGAETVS